MGRKKGRLPGTPVKGTREREARTARPEPRSGSSCGQGPAVEPGPGGRRSWARAERGPEARRRFWFRSGAPPGPGEAGAASGGAGGSAASGRQGAASPTAAASVLGPAPFARQGHLRWAASAGMAAWSAAAGASLLRRSLGVSGRGRGRPPRQPAGAGGRRAAGGPPRLPLTPSLPPAAGVRGAPGPGALGASEWGQCGRGRRTVAAGGRGKRAAGCTVRGPGVGAGHCGGLRALGTSAAPLTLTLPNAAARSGSQTEGTAHALP